MKLKGWQSNAILWHLGQDAGAGFTVTAIANKRLSVLLKEQGAATMYKVIDYVSGKPYGDIVSSVSLARTIAQAAVKETGQAHQIVFIETRVIETVSPTLSGVDFDKLPRPNRHD